MHEQVSEIYIFTSPAPNPASTQNAWETAHNKVIWQQRSLLLVSAPWGRKTSSIFLQSLHAAEDRVSGSSRLIAKTLSVVQSSGTEKSRMLTEVRWRQFSGYWRLTDMVLGRKVYLYSSSMPLLPNESGLSPHLIRRRMIISWR